jgi:5-methylcytosine-specific restriction endonuclease McrA
MKLKCYSLTVSEICNLHRRKKIELNPPYQRRPAWRTRQREDLLESVFNGIPIPAVILYKTKSGRRAFVYEVMDGKQRLETLLHFRYGGVIPGENSLGFWLRRDHSKQRARLDYKDLSKAETRREHGVGVRLFLDYKIPVIEYSGELLGLTGQKIAQWEVFTKLNSTGSRLTKNEIRKAHQTPLFFAGSRLEKKWKRKIVDTWRVFTKAEMDRYQYHEMMLELCTIHLNGGISDRRLKLDEFMRLDSLPKSQLTKAEKTVSQAIEWARAIMGDDDLRISRLSKKGDFYSFIGVLIELLSQRVVSKNTTQNRQAKKAVINALSKLAKMNERVARYKNLPIQERKNADYIVATREATDQLRNRRVRHDFWYAVLHPCFPRRLASQRLFGRELKFALWQAVKVRGKRMRCPNPENRADCWGLITYEQAEVDHRKAYSRGGATSLANGQLLCKSCNCAKSGK